MKKQFALFFVLCSFAAGAQNAVVGLPKMNVVYIGVDNDVQIAVPGYKSSDIVTEIHNGELVQRNGKTYIRVQERGEVTLITGVKVKGQTRWLDTTIFRARNMPYPVPQMGTLKNGEVETMGVIRANASRIFASLGEGFAFAGVKCKIQSYSISFLDANFFETFQCEGDVLSAKATGYINMLGPGGKIVIGNIIYCMTYENDTVYKNKRLTNAAVISVRSKEDCFVMEGGFLQSKEKFHFTCHDDNEDYLQRFAGGLKHGFWDYYKENTHKPWCTEYFDSGRLVSYKVWDSTGFMTIHAAKGRNADSMLIREFYSEGKLKREGWVATDLSNYYFYGEEITYGGCYVKRSDNPFIESKNVIKYVPIGNWKEYYPNGKLKLEGSFKSVKDLDYEHDDPTYYNIYGVSHKLFDGYTVFFDGKWTLYNEDGSIQKEYYYEDGFWRK